MKSILLIAFFLMNICTAVAQKGLPPEDPTTALVNTFYAQHEDFQPAFISRLKVPAGYNIQVAASGLGKPRMMALGKDNSLYIPAEM